MNYKDRQKLYKKLEEKRGFPLIVYVTSTRPNIDGKIAADVLAPLIDQIQELPESAKEVDFLIESMGGDALASWRIISLLRSKVKKINILIPGSAFSAATILALGGDSIVLGKYGCLGPIDPQITMNKKDGTQENFAYEDVVAFLDFTTSDVGLSEQEFKLEAFKMLCEVLQPSALGFAKRASSLAVEIGEKLLLTHMGDSTEVRTKAHAIATKLNKSFFSHGHALYKEEAKEIGLNIVNVTDEIDKIMWDIHVSFENETNAREQFNPLSEFLSDPLASSYLTNPPSLTIPPGAPDQMIMQLIAANLNQQLQGVGPDVVRSFKHAFVESKDFSDQFISKQKILVTRNPNLSYNFSVIQLSAKWQRF